MNRNLSTPAEKESVESELAKNMVPKSNLTYLNENGAKKFISNVSKNPTVDAHGKKASHGPVVDQISSVERRIRRQATLDRSKKSEQNNVQESDLLEGELSET